MRDVIVILRSKYGISAPERYHYDGSSVDLHSVKFYGYGCTRKLDQTSQFGTTRGAMAPPSH